MSPPPPPPVPLQVNMKMREHTEREHKVKQHPLESPNHQKVKPEVLSLCLSVCLSVSLSHTHGNTQGGQSQNGCWTTSKYILTKFYVCLPYSSSFLTSMLTTDNGSQDGSSDKCLPQTSQSESS